MTSLIRWLHLSDFHVGTDSYGERQLYKSILHEVECKLNEKLKPDFIFITGDIAFSGLASQYDEFVANFYFPLLDILGKNWDGHIFIVPGNHDVDRTQNKTFKAQRALSEYRRFLDPTDEGMNLRKILFPRFVGYVKAGLSDAGGEWVESPQGTFTKIVTIEDCRIGILGINTAWLSENGDRHNIAPGKEMIQDGLEGIKDTDVRIVLGHHPIDWFDDRWVNPIRSLFAKHNIIYLHGHMHLTESKFEEAAGSQFLVLQSGAAFQAREDEVWVNRFLWCELDFADKNVEVEPRRWVIAHQEWSTDGAAFPNKYKKPNSERWVFSLPDSGRALTSDSKVVSVKKIAPPSGWLYVTREYLSRYRVDLPEERILRYFDGWIPKWGEALSPAIPKRKIVARLLDDLAASQQKDELRAFLLLGAAGEGKSTVLLQIICQLVDSDNYWQIIWRDGLNTILPIDFLLSLPVSGATWLVVSDDADLIAEDVYKAVLALQKAGRNDVRFLLSCRDTDWNAAMSNLRNPNWDSSVLAKEFLRGLDFDDAKEIVKAWSQYGPRGLGKFGSRILNLDDATLNKTANELVLEAKGESNKDREKKQGALLGALLRTRFGDDLKKHVEKLLWRLDAIPIKTGGTLLDSFKYIVALHAENFFILSKPVLANLMGCSAKELKDHVLRPLGEEAAATNVSQFIVTRHRAIAEAAKEALDEIFKIDFDEVYFDALRAARRVFETGTFVPELRDWHHLSRHFYNRGNELLGIEMTNFLHETNSEDVYFINQLAGMYRDSGLAPKSLELYRDSKIRMPQKTSYFFEWSTSEKAAGNLANAVWLAAVAMADRTTIEYLDLERAIYCLNALSRDLAELFDKYNNRLFIRASGAAVQLGLMLPTTPKTSEGKRMIMANLKKRKASDITDEDPLIALRLLQQAVIAASSKTEGGLPEWIKKANDLTFAELVAMLESQDSI